MKLIPVAGLAALMAAGVGTAALAQGYPDPNYDRAQQDYQDQSQNYQDQQNVYQHQRDAYAEQQDAYQARREAYKRARMRYERARAAYDAQYGAGAYESYYGPFNPGDIYGDRATAYRGDPRDGYDRDSQYYYDRAYGGPPE